MPRRSARAALAGALTLLTALTINTTFAGDPADAADTVRAGDPADVGAPAGTTGPCTPGASYPSPLPAATMAATRISGGFSFLEGPVWLAGSGQLLLSDMRGGTGPENVQPSTIRRFTPPNTFDVFLENAGSNGLAVTGDGTRVLAATHDQRSVSSYLLSDRSRSSLASGFQGRRFNSPNDLTVRADGTIYVTDPNFQRGNRPDELGGMTGVFRVSDGEVFLVDGTVSQPNGIVLSPDETTLYTGGNADNTIFRYDLMPDGSTGRRTTFASLAGPDGATVDCAGNIYWASYTDGRIHVFAPSGEKLGTISAGRNTTNAAFGGPDGRTLFITSGTWGDFGLYQVELNVPGSPY
ncbi:SMP-30/gluconolactonase/LRE family protein [Plantactinospora sp. KLBMP9567]|uniref:SMP-30/gluconolactonase/LRE family protein n=1 Tax=Plantactinospora sp. KLBMP9567 TaxID=3085900 RepID=UPI002981F01C|nr:SMP-30/gluconolactonase/LRE family protein [Plantactinospora sp. KLBMP9567]MDW5325039.1 SMP-30/gluconolactonase/LRE family protein [Plantactinospora sp. KLBMP9567]